MRGRPLNFTELNVLDSFFSLPSLAWQHGERGRTSRLLSSPRNEGHLIRSEMGSGLLLSTLGAFRCGDPKESQLLACSVCLPPALLAAPATAPGTFFSQWTKAGRARYGIRPGASTVLGTRHAWKTGCSCWFFGRPAADLCLPSSASSPLATRFQERVARVGGPHSTRSLLWEEEGRVSHIQ